MEGQVWPFLGQHRAPKWGYRWDPTEAHYPSASLVVFGEVFFAVIHIGLDGVAARLPTSGTDCGKTHKDAR